jgi:hypothetical protein
MTVLSFMVELFQGRRLPSCTAEFGICFFIAFPSIFSLSIADIARLICALTHSHHAHIREVLQINKPSVHRLLELHRLQLLLSRQVSPARAVLFLPAVQLIRASDWPAWDIDTKSQGGIAVTAAMRVSGDSKDELILDQL